MDAVQCMSKPSLCTRLSFGVVTLLLEGDTVYTKAAGGG